MLQDGEGSRARGWPSILRRLFGEIFADRPTLPISTYQGVNAGIGLLLAAGAGVFWAESNSLSAGPVWVVAGVVFWWLSLLLSLARPTAVRLVLASQGVTLGVLALALTVHTVVWGLTASEDGSFRYGPGVVLVVTTYGMLLVGTFGVGTRRVRQLGLWLGLACELVMVAVSRDSIPRLNVGHHLMSCAPWGRTRMLWLPRVAQEVAFYCRGGLLAANERGGV